jgi:hypothetical protein
MPPCIALPVPRPLVTAKETTIQPFGKYVVLAIEPRFVRFRGHPKKNLELIILTRADCEIVNTG